MPPASIRFIRLFVVTSLLAGCGGGKGGASNGLFIAAGPISLIQSPIPGDLAGEAAVTGIVGVNQGGLSGKGVPATLTVNGVEVPSVAVGEAVYDLTAVTIPNAAPGQPLVLHASYQTYSADMTLNCPSEVTLTSPADNSTAAAGDSVTATWTGTIDYDNILYKPHIAVFGLLGTDMPSDLGFADRFENGKTSDSFALPALNPSYQWVIDLHVPGSYVSDGSGYGYCELIRRTHVVQK